VDNFCAVPNLRTLRTRRLEGRKSHRRYELPQERELNRKGGEEIARYDNRLTELAAPYEEHLSLLCSIDQIQRIAAIEIFAEIGPDLSSFPTDGHFSS
jgi:transposase